MSKPTVKLSSSSASDELKHLGSTVKRLRNAAGLSLTGLADESGVAKSIISRIEKNETNPTINTLWRLAQALNLSLDEVLASVRSRPNIVEHLRDHQVPIVRSEDQLCTLKITGYIDVVEWAQTYDFHAQPGGVLVSAPHPQGTLETLHVHCGTLIVIIDGERHEVLAGDVIRYRGDVYHELRNEGDFDVHASMVNLRC